MKKIVALILLASCQCFALRFEEIQSALSNDDVVEALAGKAIKKIEANNSSREAGRYSIDVTYAPSGCSKADCYKKIKINGFEGSKALSVHDIEE